MNPTVARTDPLALAVLVRTDRVKGQTLARGQLFTAIETGKGVAARVFNCTANVSLYVTIVVRFLCNDCIALWMRTLKSFSVRVVCGFEVAFAASMGFESVPTLPHRAHEITAETITKKVFVCTVRKTSHHIHIKYTFSMCICAREELFSRQEF